GKNLERADRLRQAEVIAESEWDESSAQLAQLAAHEQVAHSAIAGAQLQLDYAQVRSPITGRVGRRLVTPGNLVGPETVSPLTTVVSVDPLYVYLDVDEAAALALPRSQDFAVEVGFAGEDGFPHVATVDFIDNHVDPGSGTVKLRAVVPNPDGKLSDGLSARVRVPAGGAKPALLVSDRAIATDQDRRFVWVVDAEGNVQYRPVELGGLHDGLRVVREGLAADDRVIVRGLQRVHGGDAVIAEASVMTEVDAAEQELALR
ncbi:MAG: efflux RND transporter periplasmic adaptor subunit, partial [Deltaproteobacteria bacterium]|nr:efflux RND transporter periplasmic adaptor subunit [Nannocystaceae bacterium]